jgi:lipoprotein-releasing system permease protein
LRFELLIALRYLRARRRDRFVSLIAVISLAGVAIGTFALTVVLAVMSGFQEDLRTRLLAFNPYVKLIAHDPASHQLAVLSKNIARVPGVTNVAPYVSSEVMVVSTTTEGVPAYVSAGKLHALDLADKPALADLKTALKAGSIDALSRLHPVVVAERGSKRTVDLPGAIVGSDLAAQLGVGRGDALIVISPASLGAGSAPRLRRFLVTGLFHSGMYEFDSSLMFVELGQAEALLSDDPQIERGLEIRTKDLFMAPTIAGRIAAAAGPGYVVSDWTAANAPLFAALKLEKFTYFLVLLLIVLVAAFNIIATLVMVVMERRKEIAIMRAMGARPGSITAVFLMEGALLGMGGTLVGVTLGWILDVLIDRYHFIHLPADLFIVSTVPVRLYAANFYAVALAASALCVGGALYPALRARALRPVEVLRYE